MAKCSRSERAADTVIRAEAKAADTLSVFGDTKAGRMLGWFGKLGDQPPLRTLSGTLLFAGLVSSNSRLARAGARMFFAHEAATFAKNLIKDRIDRTRPRSAEAHRDRKLKRGSDPSKENSSFPSGHSAGSIAVARAFGREYPEYARPALAAAGLIAIVQVPRSAHYPSDIAAGTGLGAAVEAATSALWGRLHARGDPGVELGRGGNRV